MDYEQKYKDAFERAKECHIDGLALHQPVKAVIEHIFPELKESEDERIRKWLIGVIKSNEYGNISNVGEMPCPKPNVIAWLEKQGEQKHAEIPMTLNEAAKKYSGKESHPLNNAFIAGAKWQEEQNFTWSEEDEKLLKLSLANLIELKDRFSEGYGKVGDCIAWLKSIEKRMKGE